MLKPAMVMAAILLGATLPAMPTPKHSQGADTQRSLNLVGEIMDSRCAIDGAHDEMMRQNRTKNAKDCTLQCAKTVYQLDDQQKPAGFAGQRVRVSGTYDGPSKTMHIESIQLAE